MQGNILQGYPALLPKQAVLPSGDVTVVIRYNIIILSHKGNKCIIFQDHWLPYGRYTSFLFK